MRQSGLTAPIRDYSLQTQDRMAKARNYYMWQARLVTREIGDRVIEVGCGVGNFTGMLLDRCDMVVAVDKDPRCVDRVRARYPATAGLTPVACDAAAADFLALSRFRPDSCVCLNVLEHIEDDLRALENMASVLTPAGVIVLLVPASGALYGPVDRNLGHFRRYNRKVVFGLAERAGLRIRKLHYLNSIGFFGWWANTRVLRREALSERQIEMFDRYLMPWMSRCEDTVRPPFGQSLFVVLQAK